MPDILPPEGFDEYLKVYVTSVPENGKTNKYVIELLSKHYKIAKSRINILSGLTSKEKIIEINDV